MHIPRFSGFANLHRVNAPATDGRKGDPTVFDRGTSSKSVRLVAPVGCNDIQFRRTEKDNRIGVPVTAILMGDPPAGRSALDRRRFA